MEKIQTNNHQNQSNQILSNQTPSQPIPNSQTIKRRIGNTTFTINIHFNGTEKMEDKMMKLIKSVVVESA